MKSKYKILFPNMADFHFMILQKVFQSYGYDIELLTNTDMGVINEGLKYVHNDTCYPALLTIGQLLSALKSGKYDIDKTAVMMSQTGGGCRASNYIHLLRKALINAGMPQVPVISVNIAGLEKNSGFKISLPVLRRALAAFAYGDLLMLLNNQTKPYEVNKGESLENTMSWIDKISEEMSKRKAFSQREIKKYFDQIVASFAAIKTIRVPKIKVGIVGEIYVKYSALANNNLEDFLAAQNCEVMVPGILGFMYYSLINNMEDIRIYGGSKIKRFVLKVLFDYLSKYETYLIEAVKQVPEFTAPASAEQLHSLAGPVIGTGCKMGEGWLLTAEIIELIEHGYPNVICAQPFGCLPNHIVGKGMIRRIREMHPEANIVPIDYDPGATKVNQENRIKLMLAVANEKLQESVYK
jgi:predicted nucleotide-binding protein (sugar kinase/HSP70/actin superfamily)